MIDLVKLSREQFEKYKAGWSRSFLTNFSQDEFGNSLPWMTYPFIEFVNYTLQPHHIIFEFGSGSSTIFFAKKVQKLVALESNEMWHKTMIGKLVEYGVNNVELILMKDALTNNSYQNFAVDYLAAEQKKSPKNKIKKFDFIIIDSLKRFDCIKNSLEALSENGMIIFDDSERKGYKKIFEFMESKNFFRKDFFGIAPGQLKIKNTTVFCKKSDCQL